MSEQTDLVFCKLQQKQCFGRFLLISDLNTCTTPCVQVRLLCDQEDYETAKRVALDAGDTAATFFLARRFEALLRVPEATELYVRAKRPAFAAAYACRRGAMEEVQRLAMLCDKAGKMKYAEWLLAQNERGGAAALFQAAGAQVRCFLLFKQAPHHEHKLVLKGICGTAKAIT